MTSLSRVRVPARVSIAPMMDKTERHFRSFVRLLSKHCLLYTEMINPDAIIHGDRSRHLDFPPEQSPIALQLGSDDPELLFKAITIAEAWGYNEYNLNVGCPSDRVQFRNIGACLMADPARVAECVAAMRQASAKPVTVKHRVGIRSANLSIESYDDMANFVRTVYAAGCDGFTVHARIAILEGLSPKENRSIPPLRYQDVYRLKADFPMVPIEINGHITSWEQAAQHLAHGLDSVMIGRAAYEKPWLLSQADAFQALHSYTGDSPLVLPESTINRWQIAREYALYIQDQQSRFGLNPRSLIWPLLDMFNSFKGARKFRQTLSVPIPKGTDMLTLVNQALEWIQE